MKPVTIYTTPICGYCAAAKDLLARKGVSYAEIDIMREPARRAEMMQAAGGRRTVPQIFAGDAHLGGYDDIAALERAGKLDAALAG